MQRKGISVVDGEHATITFTRVFRHRAEHVWDAISTPEGLREWLLCSYARIDGRAGGRIELASGPPQYRSTGEILVWDPPRVLEYEWNVQPNAEMPRGEQAIFRYELRERGDETTLVVTYRRITAATARGFLPGLHAFLDRLEAQLDRSELPDWFARFREVRVEYPEWRDHAPAAGE
jgi:uncharacterized protein YndB with AHSA1/START domain